MQILLTAPELYSGGIWSGMLIPYITFDIKSFNLQVMNNFSLKYQYTNNNTLTDWVTSGWTNLYSGNYQINGTGNKGIYFNSGIIIYNGYSNILFEICFDNTISSTNTIVKSTNAPGKTLVYSANNSSGCTLTGSIPQASRPNICFGHADNIKLKNKNIPLEHSLSQNYPNPFNPITRIDFDISKKGFVSLKVYDILGREVQTLVNEEKVAGSYSVDFNGSDLTSGVYFYKLTSGEFSETKRMVLIK